MMLSEGGQDMAIVQRTPVSSAAFKSIGYDPHTRTLAVEFQSGGVHHFDDVDPRPA